MPNIGTTVQPGQNVRAEHNNSIVRGLLRALRITTGPGILGKWTDDGLHLMLSQSPNWFVPARITAKSGGDPDLPANVTYTVKGIFEDNAVLTSATPSYGRPVKGADAAFTKIRPAAVGSFCYILRDRNAEGVITAKLVLLPGGSEGETVFFEQCST
jgi:hypothetical protein